MPSRSGLLLAVDRPSQIWATLAFTPVPAGVMSPSPVTATSNRRRPAVTKPP